MSVELYLRRLGKLYETAIVSKQTDFSGLDLQTFQVVGGSRMIVFLDIRALSGGATVDLEIENGISIGEDFKLLSSTSYSAPGIYSLTFSDIHTYFNMTLTTAGGTASYTLGLTMADNLADTNVSGSVSIVDSDGDELEVNVDGSINVNASFGSVGPGTLITSYNEVAAVAAASPTTVNTYTVPPGTVAYLQKIDVSGTNIAEYEVTINSATADKRRTYFGGALNEEFDFARFSKLGIPLVAADVVEVIATHGRPSIGDFNARIQVVEVV